MCFTLVHLFKFYVQGVGVNYVLPFYYVGVTEVGSSTHG